MSQNYGEPTSGSQAGSGSGTAETAKHEAGEVAGTAKAEAGHVVDTAKHEAATVASDAASQAKQVYSQTKHELTEQAASQQQRVADGLRSIGDELESLAQGSENPGIATDLVREVSSRVSGASDWLSQRDPGSLVSEVKSFARRKPGVFIAGALLAVSGPVAEAIGDAIGLGSTAVLIWQIAKWPVLAFLVVVLVAVLYYFGPNAKQPKFRWISWGAVIAIVVLAVATLGFGVYVANFSNYERTYGSFAGVIIFLLWLWITNLALLFGAEFDAELERGRELQAGMPAEESIQLPPRDTTRIEKTAKKEEEERAEARRLRQTGGRSDT